MSRLYVTLHHYIIYYPYLKLESCVHFNFTITPFTMYQHRDVLKLASNKLNQFFNCVCVVSQAVLITAIVFLTLICVFLWTITTAIIVN